MEAAMALAAITTAALFAWVCLALFRGFFWRARERLDPAACDLRDWPAVVAVIPARNESETIGSVVAAHAASDYPGPFSVVLVDDASDDGTAAAAHAAWRGDRRLEVLAAPPLAEGWTGKLNAVAFGIAEASRLAPGARFLLLADADIELAPSTLRRLVGKAEDEGLALASLMSRLDARGFWGGLLIPAFVYFFQMLYPFAWSNDRDRRDAAAAGGCMLVRGDALEAAGGVREIRNRLIDDCALAALLKSSGERIWIGLADREAVSLRDNRALGSIWSMVERTAFAQLGHSFAMLAIAVAGLALVFLAPPAVALFAPIHGDMTAASLALAAWALMAATYLPTARLYARPGASGLALPIAAAFYLVMTMSSGLAHLRGRGGLWKGRSYSAAR